MKTSIIEYILKNRVSTTEIADCMGKKGVIHDVLPLNARQFKVGKIFYTCATNESNWRVHEDIQACQDGDIVIIDTYEETDKAIIGDIISKYLLLYKQVAGIVVIGKVRDAHRLIKENWPIWSKGVTPIGLSNNNLPPTPNMINEIKCREDFYKDSIAVCDDSGVVIIPKDFHNEDFLDKIHFIEEQEDIWYECIDRKKWSTFETICLKGYLEKD